jgi:hypothetical protein
MSDEPNPYQPPASREGVSISAYWKRRLWNVWTFAIVWPFVAISFHRLFLPLTFTIGVRWWTILVTSLFHFGWAVCIIAAIRYPAPVSTRILRGIGSLLLLFASGQVARLVFDLAYEDLR